MEEVGTSEGQQLGQAGWVQGPVGQPEPRSPCPTVLTAQPTYALLSTGPGHRRASRS